MNLANTMSIHAGGAGSGCKGPNCGRPSTGVEHRPEKYSFMALRVDVQKANQIVDAKDHPIVELPKEFLDSIRGLIRINEAHLPKVDVTRPGIVAQYQTKDGQRITLLIDGNHRAEAARRQGKPFSAYMLTPEESWKIMDYRLPMFRSPKTWKK